MLGNAGEETLQRFGLKERRCSATKIDRFQRFALPGRSL